ncbi:MAG: flagellar assembly peptidoglycan hydrolase FlgJ [Thioalkalivibrio sp.]|nr:MAG: flagellar assembly peptidoglycan hydrolase FlgJ [Thioalkalivibrio sp.]
MSANLSAAGTYTDFQGLADLRRMAREESPEAADAAARQFEALFIQMMLKSMRDAMPVDSGLDGDGVQFYREMFDQQIALEMSQGEGIGLRESLLRDLAPGARETGAAQELRMPERRVPARAAWPAEAAVRNAPVPDTEGATPSAAAARSWRPESPEAFVRELRPHAERAGAALGVAPEVLLAQSALETGWGRHVMAHADGASSHNLFGIKADARWTGPRVHVNTLEYVNGVPEQERAAFRAYDSPEESFADYVDFLQGNPRYRGALARAGDAEGYLRGLQSAGYATDPAYADKILDILGRGTLPQALGLKPDASGPTSG